ncbi:MAG: response regulator [Campylobacterota bacterium]|nr:response regulator [Campylobacterota bacterium]
MIENRTILFLEDNIVYANNTIKLLNQYVKNIIHETSMKDALDKYYNNNIDIIISDLKVDDGIALDFIKKVREDNKTLPIVIMSAHKDEDFLFKAIPLNITEYEIKPINFDKFESLINNCLKMVSNSSIVLLNKVSNIFYNTQLKVIIKDDEEVSLSKKEIKFIELLINNKSTIVTKEDLSREVWEDSAMTEAALKNFLLRLRKKAGKDSFKAIHNVGFKLN